MKIRAIKTRALIPPKDDLLSAIKESFLRFKIKERSIITVTSKVVSIWQGRCVRADKKIKKDELVKKESVFYIDRKQMPQKYVTLTIKDNILIPSAGIDESNANGYYVLWPKNPFVSAKQIHSFIKKEYGLKEFGVIITDSHTTPMRNGIMGIGIAYCGFYPLKDYRNKKDIFGRIFNMSQTNIIDSLAAAAVYKMGEGAERTPIAVIEDAGEIQFSGNDFTKKDPMKIDIDDDIYAPLLKSVDWRKSKEL